ncbi:G-protein coupled receptor [Beauveria bassiana ARSEF 2860]|uniref:G-protein coupled receptor n=1 Tax=Beauveria bassiana (strain ARSEF 2860) TaxID=655819 RepID=J4WH08_BEAB2|nr:G-protein coupled receptor [Beauveria bassiana ARSEF 2860]EJP69170.1 G-protein coupled receptor [Beauveria bassiana ARSEF 2860]
MDHNPAMDAIVNDGSDLSADQIATLVAIERTGASLSMIAIALIAASYLVYPKLRTTPNTFLLFASIANVGASIASMIGYDGLLQGEESSLCQGQAFIFEWFMQADPWWSCAMACNVFLVFFCNVDPAMFTRYIWAYCVVCFGGPLIPAITLISINDRSRGPVFGDATTTDVDDSAEESPTHVATVSSSAAHVIETTHTLHTMDSIARTSVSAAQRSNKTSFSQQITRLKETATSRLRRLDPVKMAYLRTSFIFGFTVLVTWIPSSVNRVYSIANDGHINFTLSALEYR